MVLEVPYFKVVPLLAQSDNANEVVKQRRPMVAQTLIMPCCGVALSLPSYRDQISCWQGCEGIHLKLCRWE